MVPIEISSRTLSLLDFYRHYRPILHRLATIQNAADRQSDRNRRKRLPVAFCLTSARNFIIYPNLSLDGLYISTGNYATRLQYGSKSHKGVIFASRSGGDFLITVQSISKRFTIEEILIQVLHILL